MLPGSGDTPIFSFLVSNFRFFSLFCLFQSSFFPFFQSLAGGESFGDGGSACEKLLFLIYAPNSSLFLLFSFFLLFFSVLSFYFPFFRFHSLCFLFCRSIFALIFFRDFCILSKFYLSFNPGSSLIYLLSWYLIS